MSSPYFLPERRPFVSSLKQVYTRAVLVEKAPTFMATMDVPQKKNGEMSSSSAPSWSSPEVLVLTSASADQAMIRQAP